MRNLTGKDVQQVRVIKDRGGNGLTSEDRRWKKYFVDVMNEKNDKEGRREDLETETGR